MRALCWVAVSDGPLNAAETAALARVSESNDTLRGCLADALERIEEIDRSSIADACRFVSDLSMADRHALLPCAVQLAVVDGPANATEVRTLKLLADMCCAGVGAWETLSEVYESVTGGALPDDDAPWSAPVESVGETAPSERPADPTVTLPADAARLAVEALYAAGQTAAVAPLLRHMARSTAELAEPGEPVRLLLDLARRRCADGRIDDAVPALSDAITLSRELPADAVPHESLLTLIPELMRAGRHERALQLDELALELARRGGARHAIAKALALRSTLLNLLDRPQEALDTAVESIEEGCRGPFPDGWNPLDVGGEAERALAAMQRGGEIAELWESISSLSAQAGRSAEHAEATVRAALAMIELGRHERAVPLLETALAAIAEAGPIPSCSVTDLQLHRAACHRHLGQLDRALEADRLAEASLRAGGDAPALARCLMRIAEDLLTQGDRSGAEAALREAAQLAASLGERMPCAKAHHSLGLLLQGAGRHAEALEAFGTSLQTAREPEPLAGWKVDDTILGLSRSLAATDDPAGAVELMRTLAQEARDDGDLRRAESLHAECAGVLERAGDLTAAADLYAHAESCGRLAGSDRAFNAWRLAQACCLERLGRREEALGRLRESLAGAANATNLPSALLDASQACRAIQPTAPSLASQFASALFARLKSELSTPGADQAGLALALAALLSRAAEPLLAAEPAMPLETQLRHLLKALDLLDRAERKGRLPNAVPADQVRVVVSEAWTAAADRLEASGDRMSATGARASAAQWKRAV